MAAEEKKHIHYNSLKIDSDNYEWNTFIRLKKLLDLMEVKAYEGNYDWVIAEGTLALKHAGQEEDVDEIYHIINDVIALAALEGVRNS